MKLNKKEKYIKQVLESQDSPVNTSALWDAIEERVPHTESQPRRRWWMMLIPFCLGGLVISTLWYTTAQMSKTNQNISTSFDQSKETQTHATQDLVSQREEVESNKKIGDNASVDNESSNKKTAVPTQNKSKKVISQNNKATQTSIPTGDFYSNTQTNTNTEKQSIPTSVVGDRMQLATSNQRQPATGTPNNSRVVQTPVLLSEIESEGRPLVQFVSGLESLKLKLLYLAQPLLGKLNLAITTRTEPNGETESKASWTLIANTGVNLVSADISVREGSILRQDEFANEQQLVGYQGGISIQRTTSKGWSLRSQLGMTDNVARYQSNEEIVLEDTDEDVIEIYNGVESTGQVQTFTQVNQDIKWHRTHQQYNLDLFLGKQFTLTPKLNLLAEVGLSNTLYQTHQGYYFADANPAFTKVSDNNSNPYKTGYRINGSLGTSLHYKLNEKFSIGLGTSAALPFDLLRDSQHYQSKNSQLRFDFLVGYKLN